jgi:PhnB protein
MSVKPVPEGFHTITPYITLNGAARLIEFLKQVFDAKEKELLKQPDGSVWHAEMKIGDSILMVSEASERWKAMPASINLYVNDADATYKRALQAGAKSLMEPATHFYGDRSGGVEDPFGNRWWISTHVEDVSKEELERRAEEFTKAQAR